MIGIAEVVGTPRMVSAGILRALGFPVVVADSDMADQADPGSSSQPGPHVTAPMDRIPGHSPEPWPSLAEGLARAP